MDLKDKQCVPCELGGTPLTKERAVGYLTELRATWDLIDENKKIRAEFEFKDFLSAVDFVNKIAKVAESESHHPDIYIFYNTVTIELWTHAMNGLSENDFIVAAKIENLYSQT